MQLSHRVQLLPLNICDRAVFLNNLDVICEVFLNCLYSIFIHLKRNILEYNNFGGLKDVDTHHAPPV